MDKKDIVLSVKNLKLWFDNDYGEAIQILNGISFDIHAGETLGIVGESGCGKSMTSLAIMRLVKSPPARMYAAGGRSIHVVRPSCKPKLTAMASSTRCIC